MESSFNAQIPAVRQLFEDACRKLRHGDNIDKSIAETDIDYNYLENLAVQFQLWSASFQAALHERQPGQRPDEIPDSVIEQV